MGKVKKKCCRSKPKRCAGCPVVAQRMTKIESQALKGKDLRRAVKAARFY
jgi:stage V sporulation protein SpoVS